MVKNSEIKRYGKIVVLEHWLAMIFVLILSFTGIFLLRDWFVHEFHIYDPELYISTPSFTSDFHLYGAFLILVTGIIHLAAHVAQKEKHILPKFDYIELKSAIYSLLFLVFLAKRQERGSDEKFLKSQRIIYIFTIYVLLLAGITGFAYYAGIIEEQMLIAHLVSGVLVILVVIHRIALVIRKRDGVALRSVLASGTMPRWYIKKNHRIWYDEIERNEEKDLKVAKKKKKTPAPTTTN
jgi:cytochrome b subunit of formate dehydrogenase